MSTWLKGVVKSISSGDRLVVVVETKHRKGKPPEKEIVLSGVSAPRLGTFDGSRPSEPFAQDAREYMRRLLIGKPVIFKIDYAIPNSNRESATVYLDQRTNVAVAAIGAGWAKHRPPPAGKETQVPAHADMAAAEEKAKADCLGMWTKDQAAIAAAVRQPEQKEDPKELLSYAGGAGGRVTCLAEGIVNASCIRVSVERNGATKTVLVYAAGVQCPNLGKPAQGGEAGGQDNGAAATEPYAREAKHFTEMNVLQRTCELVLAGTDKFGNLYAQITTKPEGSDASGGSAAAIAAAGHAQSSSVNALCPIKCFFLSWCYSRKASKKRSCPTKCNPPLYASTFSTMLLESVETASSRFASVAAFSASRSEIDEASWRSTFAFSSASLLSHSFCASSFAVAIIAATSFCALRSVSSASSSIRLMSPALSLTPPSWLRIFSSRSSSTAPTGLNL
ncbi:hypothetical protein PPROV_001031700 [Pycnococcus provasolii]|uniref:TNase-like domain-containing protein n=1 Tax=Pycnococcus provasolii TaxID=41880 RepID=A0A830I3I3_9CHLO|nr:hypothetical protein PPROV_001031700 [Pycnococcus provasolii]